MGVWEYVYMSVSLSGSVRVSAHRCVRLRGSVRVCEKVCEFTWECASVRIGV